MLASCCTYISTCFDAYLLLYMVLISHINNIIEFYCIIRIFFFLWRYYIKYNLAYSFNFISNSCIFCLSTWNTKPMVCFENFSDDSIKNDSLTCDVCKISQIPPFPFYNKLMPAKLWLIFLVWDKVLFGVFYSFTHIIGVERG